MAVPPGQSLTSRLTAVSQPGGREAAVPVSGQCRRVLEETIANASHARNIVRCTRPLLRGVINVL